MRLGLVGDLHGTTKEAEYVLDRMGERKISHVFLLGDAGVWPGLDGLQYMDALQRSAEKNQLSIFIVPGNHDDHDYIDLLPQFAPSHKGFYYARSQVLISPKVNSFKLANKVFGVAGGAVSVDKEWRIEYNSGRYYDATRGRYIKIKNPTKVWWAQEALSDDEVSQAQAIGKVDYLLTHDASDHTPWKRRLKPDWESQAHRQKIDKIIEATEPEIHFGGHFHEFYDWTNTVNGGHYVRHITLEADHEAMHRVKVAPAAKNWAILDTETNEVAIRGEGMTFRSMESD